MKTTRILAIVIGFVAALSLPASDSPETADVSEIRMRGIGWAVLRSQDPRKLAEFYFALGFKEWASSERIIGLHAGGGAALEIGLPRRSRAGESPHKDADTSCFRSDFSGRLMPPASRKMRARLVPASSKHGHRETRRCITSVTRKVM